MPLYRIVFEGTIVDVWEVSASSAEEAREKVGPGRGRWVHQEWTEEPTAKVEEVDLS